MEVISNHNWALTVGTFLPLVGVLIMLFIPKAEEALIKSVAIATAIATLAVGIYTMVQCDFGNPTHADTSKCEEHRKVGEICSRVLSKSATNKQNGSLMTKLRPEFQRTTRLNAAFHSAA